MKKIILLISLFLFQSIMSFGQSDTLPKEQSFRMAQKELREMIGPGQNKPDWAAFVMLDGI